MPTGTPIATPTPSRQERGHRQLPLKHNSLPADTQAMLKTCFGPKRELRFGGSCNRDNSKFPARPEKLR